MITRICRLVPCLLILLAALALPASLQAGVSFTAKTDFPTGSFPWSVAIGDLNGDGNPDLAVANGYSDSVSVLLGTGSGSFGAKTDFPTGFRTEPIFVAIGDLNGDGKPDLAVANALSSSVSVLLGTGSGSFGAMTGFPIGSNQASVAIGDLNGDGKPDLAVANKFSDSVSVLLGTGSIGVPGGTITLSSTVPGTPGTPAAAVTINAANLSPASGNLTATAPANVNISVDGTNWTTAGSPSVSIPYTGGALSSYTFYARLAGTGTFGTIGGNISLSGGGAATVTQAVSGALTGTGPGVHLPDITVNTMGQLVEKGGGLSGVYMAGGVGSFTTTGFAGATVQAGDTVTQRIYPPAGKAFQIAPGFTSWVFYTAWGLWEGLASNTVTVTLNGSTSGSSSAGFTNGSTYAGTFGTFIGATSSQQPTAAYTFTSIDISFVASATATLPAASLTEFQFYTNGTSVPGLSLVDAPSVVQLPDITVSAMSQRTESVKDSDITTSGVSTASSLGSASANAFAGGTINAGDTVKVRIRAAAGKVFQLLPGYNQLSASAAWGSTSSAGGTTSVVLNDVVGGTAPGGWTNGTLGLSSTGVALRNATVNQPGAAITFTSMDISFTAAAGIVLSGSSFSGVDFTTTGSDPTAYLSLVDAQGGNTAPTLSSPTATSITDTTATLGGNVTSDGGDPISERGIVIALTSTNNDPQISGTGVTKLTTTGTTGVFTLNVATLQPSSSYSFKAYATNSLGTSYSAVSTFTTLSIIEAWRKFYTSISTNTGTSANTADFDRDGIVNLLEFAFGTDPTLTSSGPPSLTWSGTFASATFGTTGQPITAFEAITNGIDFRALFVRRKDYIAAGLTYTPQFSANLITWSPSAAVPTVLADDGTYQIVSVPYPAFIAGKKARFFTVSVSVAP